MYYNFKIDCGGIQNIFVGPVLIILDRDQSGASVFTFQPQVFRSPVRRVLSPKPPCMLAPPLSQPRQADQSQASERASGELGRKWLRISMVSARLRGRVLFASLLLCWSAGREVARVCGCVVLIGVCLTKPFILV
jgi:hypothetical protein